MERMKTMKYWLLAAVLVTSSCYAHARGMRIIDSTPDIAVDAATSIDIVIPGGLADYVFIQNDCVAPVYFGFQPALSATPNLLMHPSTHGIVFAERLRITTLRASSSHDVINCTVTVIFGRE